MQVFLCWSGERSKALANLLHAWLPNVLQAVEPFMSAEDIPKGAQWAASLSAKLKDSAFSIICVTPENRRAAWLNFEAGALTNALGNPKVCPLLLGLISTDIVGPLTMLQLTEASREDIHRLIRTMNENIEHPLLHDQVSRAFDRWWGDLEQGLDQIEQAPELVQPSHRSNDDVIRETLDAVRDQNRLLNELAGVVLRLQVLDVEPQKIRLVASPKELGFTIGDTVEHPQWGRGIVQDIEGPTSDPLVTVNFSDVAAKMLMLKSAPLQKVMQPQDP